MPPGKNLLYQRVIKTPFVFQHLQDRCTKELCQWANIYHLHHIKIPALGEWSIRHQSMDMRMPFGIVSKGLDGQGDSRNPQIFTKGDPKKPCEAR